MVWVPAAGVRAQRRVWVDVAPMGEQMDPDPDGDTPGDRRPQRPPARRAQANGEARVPVAPDPRQARVGRAHAGGEHLAPGGAPAGAQQCQRDPHVEAGRSRQPHRDAAAAQNRARARAAEAGGQAPRGGLGRRARREQSHCRDGAGNGDGPPVIPSARPTATGPAIQLMLRVYRVAPEARFPPGRSCRSAYPHGAAARRGGISLRRGLRSARRPWAPRLLQRVS